MAAAKIKNPVIRFLPRFYPWKATFGCRNAKWLDQKFRKKVFSIPYQKRRTQDIMFLAVFNLKKSWKLVGDFFDFSPRPNVSSNIIITMGNMENDVAFAVWKRYPSLTSGITSFYKRRVARKSSHSLVQKRSVLKYCVHPLYRRFHQLQNSNCLTCFF